MENIWEVDLYRYPLPDETGKLLWELVICQVGGGLLYSAIHPQSEVSANWVAAQLEQVMEQHLRPEEIRVFRPQSLHLLEAIQDRLKVAIAPTRHTPTLKQWLQQRARHHFPTYDPLALEQPPPNPLPDYLLGNQWRFASLPAADLADAFSQRMMPILDMPEAWLPLNLGVASTVPIPGVVIDAGRRSLPLAIWLQETHPISLNYTPGSPNGLILEAGLVDRWIMATFDDPDVTAAAQTYSQRRQASQGLHFLLVQPDDSGMTYTGFWLLRSPHP